MALDPDTNADQTAQGFGVKKSDFNDQGVTPFSGTATIDVVINGENVRQSLDNFLTNAQLAVILPVGDAGATPVLQTVGATKNIRGIEDGSGILASVSPSNGITIKHNFQQGTGGAPLFTGITADSPQIGNIIAGQDINVASVPGGVQISASGTPATTKTVLINTMSDFPSAVAGVRTLAGGTDYFATNDLITSDRFDVSAGDIVVRGSDSSVISFEYTGTGDMFTGVDATFRLGRITLIALTGRCWNMTDNTGAAFFQFIDGTIEGCGRVGVIQGPASGYGAVQLNNVAMFGIITDGIEFTGTIGACLGLTNIATITAGSVYNLGTATFGSFNIDDSLIDLVGGGSFFISGTASSANILSGSLGTVVNTRIRGAGTALQNVTPDDDRWQFSLNDDIRDSRTDGLLSLQGNAVATTISGSSSDGSNAALIAGAWSTVAVSQMTGTAAGRLTHTGAKDTRLPVTGSVTVEPVSGGTIQINAYLVIDGVVDVGSRRSGSASPGSPAAITLPWQNTYAPTEFSEIFVENTANAVNILVSSAIHRVN